MITFEREPHAQAMAKLVLLPLLLLVTTGKVLLQSSSAALRAQTMLLGTDAGSARADVALGDGKQHFFFHDLTTLLPARRRVRKGRRDFVQVQRPLSLPQFGRRPLLLRKLQ